MKRLLFALLSATLVFGLVYGAAATLTVNGGTIQAGGDSSLQCDTDGVYVWAWGLNNYPVDYGVESVKISGVDAACDGARIMARITLDTSNPADNSTYAYTSGVSPYNTGTYFVTASGTTSTVYELFLKHSDYTTQWYVDPAAIVGIYVWLEGSAI
jgi:hypothetical protein